MFAVPVLKALAETTDLQLVVTQPDRPVGRGRKLEAPPVKKAAKELGLKVIQPSVVKGRRFTSMIATYSPNLIVTAAFGRLLGKSLLELPPLGCLNVHASLLPRYRGAAPISRAILNGDQKTGVCVMKMDEGLDTGDVYHSLSLDIGENETTGELTLRMAKLGAKALVDVIGSIGDMALTAQDHGAATYASMLQKKDGLVDWSKDAKELHCHVRGMHPWPCAFTVLNGQTLKLHRSFLLDSTRLSEHPGTVLDHSDQGIDVACGKGVLRLTDVQLPGKKQLSPRQFFAGNKQGRGSLLG